jgi:hypothetical protein
MNRKQAIRDFKERKSARGIFAVRCNAGSLIWIGSSPNLEAWRNSLWFSLRSGGYPNKALQQAWNTHGEPSFQFEILEQLDDDISPLALNDLLKERKLHWTKQLAALTI